MQGDYKDLLQPVNVFAMSDDEGSDGKKHLQTMMWIKDEVNNIIIRIDGALKKKQKYGILSIR